MKTVKTTVFHGKNDIRVEEVDRRHAAAGEAAIRVTLTDEQVVLLSDIAATGFSGVVRSHSAHHPPVLAG